MNRIKSSTIRSVYSLSATLPQSLACFNVSLHILIIKSSVACFMLDCCYVALILGMEDMHLNSVMSSKALSFPFLTSLTLIIMVI